MIRSNKKGKVEDHTGALCLLISCNQSPGGNNRLQSDRNLRKFHSQAVDEMRKGSCDYVAIHRHDSETAKGN